MTHSSPNSTMPGAFNFSTRDAGAVPRLSGAKSHIFQPPRTPSVSASSSLYLTRSGGSTDCATAGRKRARVDYDAPAPKNERTEGEPPGSPVPLVNTKYLLAGGLDTPGQAASHIEDARESEYFSDVGYRRELSDDTKLQGMLGEESRYQSFAPLSQENMDEDRRNSRVSQRPYTSQGDGWNKSALGVVGSVVGGVVGKVWEFCKTSAFKGFHAGGGTGYTISETEDPMHPSIEEQTFWESEKHSTTYGLIDRTYTPIPGQFPEDFIPNYLDRATPDDEPPRPAKRRQVGNSSEELAQNWVVVPSAITQQTPTKPRPTGAARYSMATASSAGRTGRSLASRPASRASGTPGLPRRPMLQSRISQVSHAGSPALQSRAGASYASPRSPGGKIPRASPMGNVKTPSTSANSDSPAAKEAQKWAAVKRKEEREADESIRRLDAQLKAMIKQGKEALGTKVEIEGDVDDDYIPPSPSPRKTGPGKVKKWGF